MLDPELDPELDPTPDPDPDPDPDSDSDSDWSISLAGCGFMGVYYIGAAGCVLQRCPELIHRAARVYGSSAGALLGAVLTLGIPLELCCEELMSLALRARAHRLGPLHPDFDLMGQVRDFLMRALPEDAHVRASGRLCISVTRVPNGRNELLSEFSSNEELRQALICSCFVPFYCGVIPPTYRGVRYVDGAVSDNLPRCHQKKTITFSPYAGESDVCPRPQGQLYMHQVRFNNLSFEVNPENLFRVTSTFFPPEPQVLAEICQNGFEDALRFLQENGLVSEDPVAVGGARMPCCEWEHLFKTEDQSEQREINQDQSEQRETNQDQSEQRETNQDQSEQRETNQDQSEQRETNQDQSERSKPEDHSWLDPRLTEKLPSEIRAVLCRSCRLSRPAPGLLSRVKSYLSLPRSGPVRSPWSMAHRLVEWLPELRRDMSWLYDLFSPIWKDQPEQEELFSSAAPLRRCHSLPSGLALFHCSPNSSHIPPPTALTTPPAFTWDQSDAALPLTPPPTPTCSPAPSPGASWGFGLGRAVGWIRSNIRTTAAAPPAGMAQTCTENK